MPPKRKVKDAESSSRSTTTEKEFAAQLSKNGIVHGRVETKPPLDEYDLRQYLSRPRESNSPEDQEFKDYVAGVEYAGNEATMQSNSWLALAKQPSHLKTPGYCQDYNFAWTEVEGPLREGISDPKPDISESYRTSQYPPTALDALGGTLAPTQYKGAMPALCVEYKGPDGTMFSAEKQCAFDGAIMTNSALETHTYMGKDPNDFYGKTQALTFAANGDLVRLYGNHVLQNKSSLQYHQYPLFTQLPTESLQHFKETRLHVRNAQDWARQQATFTKESLWNNVDSLSPRDNILENTGNQAVITPPPSSSKAKGKSNRKKNGKAR